MDMHQEFALRFALEHYRSPSVAQLDAPSAADVVKTAETFLAFLTGAKPETPKES